MHESRPMCRKDRTLEKEAALHILAAASHGTLATVSADGWPYAVPVNHGVEGESLYLHCAQVGHKLDNIAHDSRVCYSAVLGGEIDTNKLTTYYESATVFGQAKLIEDLVEKSRLLQMLVARFCGQCTETQLEEIERMSKNTVVVRIDIESISGKANRKA